MVTTKVMVVEPRRERYVLITARWNASSLASTALKLQNMFGVMGFTTCNL